MKAPIYAAYSGTISIIVATERIEAAPSHVFQAAKLHEDFCAQVRVILREHRQCGPASELQAAARRLQTYFPTHQGAPLYALRELVPAGTARGVDQDWKLEVMTIRYNFTMHLLPAAVTADPVLAEGIERNLEFALFKLFQAAQVPQLSIAGDEGIRLGDGTDVAIVVDMGPASGRTSVEIHDLA